MAIWCLFEDPGDESFSGLEENATGQASLAEDLTFDNEDLEKQKAFAQLID